LDATLAEDGDDMMAFSIHHPDSDPVRWTEARDEWEAVAQAINALTEEQRQVLVGRFILGYDVATVAGMIGKKANAVKALQFRALNSLHRLLRQQDRSEEEYYRRVHKQEEAE
jgi:RNA polymerase sigma-70 factor (ECF subfamily)